MDIVRYIAGGLIALFGAYIIVGTYITLFTKIFTKKEGGMSLVPLIAPLAFVGGVAITPLPFSHWLWLAFFVDLNTIGYVIQPFLPSPPEDG